MDDNTLTLPPFSKGDEPSRGRGAAVWRRVTQVMREAILSGQWPTGARLPREAVLAAHFDINRHTLRRAMGVLVRDGLIHQAQGRGTFVAFGQQLEVPLDRRPLLCDRPGWTTAFQEMSYIEAGARLGDRLRLDSHMALVQVVVQILYQGQLIGFAHLWFGHERFARIADVVRREETLDAALADYGLTALHAKNTQVSARDATTKELGILESRHPRVLLDITQTISAIDPQGMSGPVYVAQIGLRTDRVRFSVPED